MLSKTLTTETWNDELPRMKIRMGEVIIYTSAIDLEDGHKGGLGQIRRELDMMEFARSCGVRVPRVYSYHREGDVETCVMEYVEGTMLEEIKDEEVISTVKGQVREYVGMMETVTHNEVDFVLSNNLSPCQTFANSKAFYRYLLRGIETLHRRYPDGPKPSYDVEAAVAALPDEPIVFSHGDLYNSNNVIVGLDGTLALIDFECAGYHPLHVARWLAGIKDNDPVSRLVDAICTTSKAVSHGEEEKYCAGMPSLEDQLKRMNAYVAI